MNVKLKTAGRFFSERFSSGGKKLFAFSFAALLYNTTRRIDVCNPRGEDERAWRESVSAADGGHPMSQTVSIIVRLTLKLEAYAFLMIVPLAVYFVVLSGAHRGPDVILIVYGAVLAVPAVLIFGLPMRIMHIHITVILMISILMSMVETA